MTDTQNLQPSVSIVLVNTNGLEHLPDCLASIWAQDYPPDLFDVILVDNGSTDGSLEYLAEHHPQVKVLAQGRNLGFARAVTVGAEASSSECIALVNDDSRLHPRWLSEITAKYDRDEGYVCVAAVMVDWAGTHFDFHEGVVNFHGMSAQLDYGRPVGDVDVEDGKDLLFACGGAMLCARDVWLETGGFDPHYFAYFEDVDFGWRLWVLGYKCRLASRAVSFHKLHGTWAKRPMHQRLLFYERNALRSIIKNYDQRNMERTLGPALMLTVERTMFETGSQRSTFEYSSTDLAETETVHRNALSRLWGVVDLVDDLDRLMGERRWIQARRKRSDAEILTLFGAPFRPLGNEAPSYVSAFAGIVDAFGIGAMFPETPAVRVVAVCDDPADQVAEVAAVLGRSTPVTLALPLEFRTEGAAGSELKPEAPGVAAVEIEDEAALVAVVADADVVVASAHTIERHKCLRDVPGVLAVSGAPVAGMLELADVVVASNGHGAESERVLDLAEVALVAREPWRFRGAREGGQPGDHLLRTSIDVQRHRIAELEAKLDRYERLDRVVEPLRALKRRVTRK